ncbi:MAG: MFS transporter [Firmicutes bacterium]|nr:MFS transporter [Bacillota bacterium]
MEKKKYESNIKKIFIIMFLNSLIFAYVIERIFAMERGITVLQMQYILIIFSIVSIILEIPCGVLADKWKRKYVWTLGIFFSFFEFFVCIFAYNFKMFVLAFILAAIGSSLKSGTWDSILYESLNKLERNDEYEKLRGYIKFLDYTSSGIVGIFGGYISYRYGLVTNYWLSLLGTPFAILICLSIYEPNKRRKISKEKNVFKEAQIFTWIKEAICVIKKSKNLFRVIFYSGIIGAILYGQLHEMGSLIYKEIGIPLYMFGYIGFVITLLGGLSGVLSAKLKIKFSYKAIFRSILILSTISIFMFSNAKYSWEILYLMIAIFLMELVSPLTSGYIHNHIKDDYRATISSIEAFIMNGLTILVGLAFGYFSNKSSVFEGFLILAIILCLYTVIFFIQDIRVGNKGLKTKNLVTKIIKTK